MLSTPGERRVETDSDAWPRLEGLTTPTRHALLELYRSANPNEIKDVGSVVLGHVHLDTLRDLATGGTKIAKVLSSSQTNSPEASVERVDDMIHITFSTEARRDQLSAIPLDQFRQFIEQLIVDNEKEV